MDSTLEKVYHGQALPMAQYVILHNIRSAHNVGSIFRTADGAGVSKVYLTGYTPAPVDRFGREQPEIKKTSLGATGSVPWEKRETIEEVMSDLKARGIEIAAVEQSTRSENYREYVPKENVAYIFGNETEGIDNEVLEKTDKVIAIPMHGAKESLNVSVVAGIILFNA